MIDELLTELRRLGWPEPERDGDAYGARAATWRAPALPFGYGVGVYWNTSGTDEGKFTAGIYLDGAHAIIRFDDAADPIKVAKGFDVFRSTVERSLS